MNEKDANEQLKLHSLYELLFEDKHCMFFAFQKVEI